MPTVDRHMKDAPACTMMFAARDDHTAITV
jgi:hypothetical protein